MIYADDDTVRGLRFLNNHRMGKSSRFSGKNGEG